MTAKAGSLCTQHVFQKPSLAFWWFFSDHNKDSSWNFQKFDRKIQTLSLALPSQMIKNEEIIKI